MKSLTNIIQNQHHPRKPIKYWEAHIPGIPEWRSCIDINNSIAILRAKYGNSVIYKAIR